MRMRGVKGCVSVIVIGRIVCDVTVGVAGGGVTSEEYPSPMECGQVVIKHSCGFRKHINVQED